VGIGCDLVLPLAPPKVRVQRSIQTLGRKPIKREKRTLSIIANLEFSMMPLKFGDNIPERGARTEACNFINLNMTK
jgi:hypothetical protein